MKKGNNSIIKGATLLGAGAFISKLLGAIYRIPLTNIMGSDGLGLYQMVFPVYALLLDFSGAGIPSAISKIISSSEKEKRLSYAESYLKTSLILLMIFGIAGTMLMMIFSLPVSRLQGNENAMTGYIFLAPAIFFVSMISCFRGYFQGLMNMKPTAISQITEQFIKLIAGLIFVSMLMPDIKKAVAGATFAITLSEIVSLLYLFIEYKKFSRKNRSLYDATEITGSLKERIKKIIKITFPITLTGIMIPLSQFIDSFLIINIIGKYRPDGTGLYGLLTGVTFTIINLPVSVCYGIAQTAIPAVSGSADIHEQNGNIKKVIALTLVVAVPCAILTAIFSPVIINILFGKLGETDRLISTDLLRLTSINIILLSLLQTENAILIGKGKVYYPIISLFAGITVKTVLSLMLLPMEELNIFGGGIAVIACYFTVCLLNLIMIFSLKVKNESKYSFNRECRI